MKRILLVLALLWSISILAQEGYKFTDEIRLPVTSVKDQYRSGTCWSFSTISFIEAEMIRINKIKDPKDYPDLSEMFVVNLCYKAKARNYVHWGGKVNFGPGGEPHDVMCVLKKYGIVPEEVYPGLNYGTEKHVHTEMDRVLQSYVEAVVKGKRLTTAWDDGFDAVVDAYLGPLPETFTYKGKQYTPQTFLKEVVKVNPDDYVPITSFTHHPFYSKFILEMPDNWQHAEFYNVPLEDMLRIIDYALENGYTVAWAADVSEPYFSHRKGVAVVPKAVFTSYQGTEWARWEKVPEEKLNLDHPGPEMKITQELRQQAWERYETTDDHGMHIIGRAHDQNGTTYYIVKNSWGETNPYNGYIYVSRAYVAYKTMHIMVHKDAIPKDIKQKLGL